MEKRMVAKVITGLKSISDLRIFHALNNANVLAMS